MGRHLLSTTALSEKLIDQLQPIAEVLPPNQRRVIEKFCEIISQERVAIAQATDLLPLEAALVILLVEERRSRTAENEELYQEIRKLKREIESLKEQL
jgi:hypothetical protein